MNRPLRILVVDDHELVREGQKALLESHPGWQVCGMAANGRDAVAQALKLRPDVVIMDVGMPELNGVDATRQILAEHPEIKVLIVSMHESERLVRDLLDAGARGYLLKSDPANDLVTAVAALVAGRSHFTSKVGDLLLSAFTGKAASPHLSESGPLTHREREVVQLIAEGKSTKEVAGVLNLSVKTVETHRAHIMKKLNLSSVSDLVRYAIRNEIVMP